MPLPAYMVTNNGHSKVFIGNYDSLGDLAYDYPSTGVFATWREKDNLFVRLCTPEELKERKLLSRNREVVVGWLPAT